MAVRMVTKNIVKSCKFGVQSSGPECFFSEIMVPWYHGTYPSPNGEAKSRFSPSEFSDLGPDSLDMQKVVFRVDPLVPPYRLGGTLNKKSLEAASNKGKN